MEPSVTGEKPRDTRQTSTRGVLTLAAICAALAVTPFVFVLIGNAQQRGGYYVFVGFLALLLLWPHVLMLGMLLRKPTQAALGMAIQVGGAHALLAIVFFTLLSVVINAEKPHLGKWSMIAFLFAPFAAWGFLHWLLRRSARSVYEELWPEEKTGGTSRASTAALATYLFLFVMFVAVAIPSLIRDGVGANETSAMAALRSLRTVAEEYRETYANGYPSNLAQLGPTVPGREASCKQADLIDAVLAAGVKNGFVFSYRPGLVIEKPKEGCPAGVKSYAIEARPTEHGKTGRRSFYVEENGVFRWTHEDRAANAKDPPIE